MTSICTETADLVTADCQHPELLQEGNVVRRELDAQLFLSSVDFHLQSRSTRHVTFHRDSHCTDLASQGFHGAYELVHGTADHADALHQRTQLGLAPDFDVGCSFYQSQEHRWVFQSGTTDFLSTEAEPRTT
ncbi:hypothetical protein D3C76_996280 [compost metagenome]